MADPIISLKIVACVVDLTRAVKIRMILGAVGLQDLQQRIKDITTQCLKALEIKAAFGEIKENIRVSSPFKSFSSSLCWGRTLLVCGA